MRFEEVLRQLVAEAGTQTGVAWRAGITPKHLNRMIMGKASLTPAVALKLEKAVGMTAEEMLGWQLHTQVADLRRAQEEQQSRRYVCPACSRQIGHHDDAARVYMHDFADQMSAGLEQQEVRVRYVNSLWWAAGLKNRVVTVGNIRSQLVEEQRA